MNDLRLTGLSFVDSGRITIEITRRADLAADRIGRGGSNQVLGVIRAGSMTSAKTLRKVLLRLFHKPGAVGDVAAADVPDILTRCRRMKFTVYGLADDPKPRKDHTRKPVIEARVIPDPAMSRAELLEQIRRQEHDEGIYADRHLAERRLGTGTAKARSRPVRPQAGYQNAATDMLLLIGGLARVKERTDTQTEAAMKFKQLAETAQLGGARSVDYSAVKVDTSGQTANDVAEAGADARSEFHAARKKLGLNTRRLAVVELVVVEGRSISEVAQSVGLGSGGSARRRTTRTALEAADVLARHFGFVPSHRSRIRQEGDLPTQSPDGFRTQLTLGRK